MSQSPLSNTDSTGRSSKSNHRPLLIDPGLQLQRLGSLDLEACPHGGAFDASLTAAGWQQIAPAPLEVFQINLGKLCNMLCRHCHVDAGPDRTDAMMDRADLSIATLLTLFLLAPIGLSFVRGRDEGDRLHHRACGRGQDSAAPETAR